MRRGLRVAGLVNARDLGGLPTATGTTPTGVFYRSENVDQITPTGWQAVFDAGIRTVVDLRQSWERDKDTSPRPPWLTTVHTDLDGLAEHPDFWADYWDNGLVATALYYLPHLAALPGRSVAALSAIVNAPEGGVLFHCMGGRDRTGLIALLLLAAAGTEPDAIVDDYLVTVRLGDTRAASAHRNNDEPELNAICARRGTTTEGAFRAAVDGLDLDRVLAGMSEDDRALLRNWRGHIT
ncbi:MAG TPA: tyrosine-protein phosphatase [Pseudonocardiaceae bacterium]|nr:tyrosine-protein phosphatase [Pseudonocardiaceae bacterium]